MVPVPCLQMISGAQSVISKTRNRIRTVGQELEEIRRREVNDRAVKYKVKDMPFIAPIRECHRYDWTRRYITALGATQDSEEELEVRLACSYSSLSYQRINASMYQRINVSTYQRINLSTYQRIDVSTYRRR